jgi:hypothetical protein
MRKYIVPFLTIVLVALSINVYALQKQSAAAPGEVLDSDGDETTAVQMTGLFAVEVTGDGVGTIQIKRSEDKTNWIVVKTLTNASAGDQRKYLYEYFGDEDSSNGAWYKAVLSGNPTSGSFRVRLVK